MSSEYLSQQTINAIVKQITDLQRHPAEGITRELDKLLTVITGANAGPDYFFVYIKQVKLNEENVADVYAEIKGPENTPFENGLFKMKLQLPSDYPSQAPKGFFLTKIFHPNIRQPSGEICVNTLKRDWKPDLGLRHVLMVIRCLLIEPFPESALNEEAARMLLEEYDEYFARAKMFTQIHAKSASMTTNTNNNSSMSEKKSGNVLDVKDGNSLSENKEGSGKENGGSGGEQNVVKKAKKIDKKKSLRRL